MLAFSVILVGQKAAIPLSKDFTFIEHAIGQYLPSEIKQFPPVASLRSLPLHAIPIDLKVAHPAAVSSLFILIWGISLAFFSQPLCPAQAAPGARGLCLCLPE